MLRVKLPVVDRIYPQSNKFAMGVENKATCQVTKNLMAALICHCIFQNKVFNLDGCLLGVKTIEKSLLGLPKGGHGHLIEVAS